MTHQIDLTAITPPRPLRDPAIMAGGVPLVNTFDSFAEYYAIPDEVVYGKRTFSLRNLWDTARRRETRLTAATGYREVWRCLQEEGDPGRPVSEYHDGWVAGLETALVLLRVSFDLPSVAVSVPAAILDYRATKAAGYVEGDLI